MVKKRILAFFEVDSELKKRLKKKFARHRLLFYANSLDDVKLSPSLLEAECLVVFVHSHVSREMMERLSRLRCVITMSTGVDHIDTIYAREQGIRVLNVSAYGKNTVAEHAFALILALSRKLYPAITRVMDEHEFETDDSLQGFDLYGKTLGIIGYGHIGKHMKRIAKGFGMRVLIHTVHPGKGKEFVSLSSLLRESDIVSLHVPLTKKTFHLMNKDTLSTMKDGAYLVNTSRGEVVDTCALMKVLKSGKLAGAGLDVLEDEDAMFEDIALAKNTVHNAANLKVLLDEKKLVDMKNVIITPHNAFNSVEAVERIYETTIKNIEKFLKT